MAVKRISSLDGLRAISIALVLTAHAGMGQPIGSTVYWRFFGRGDLGVTIFFVISGFLITTLLLREEEKTGQVSLRDFYVRRFFRIVPPFYVYLFVVLIAWRFDWLAVNRTAWFSALFFVRDYARIWDWPTGHSWSLSVEEQFYILWPCALVWLGRKKGLRLALSLLVLVPIARTVSHGIWNHGLADLFSFHTNADSLMTGCVLALIESKSWFRELWRKIESPWLAFACVVFLVGISPALYLRFASWYWLTVGMSLDNFAIAYAMYYVIRSPEGFTGRILNSKAMVHVGVLSYSLYLWQQPFLSPDTKHIFLSFIAAFACAELSWYLVETPSRWMRDRIAMSCQASLVRVQR